MRCTRARLLSSLTLVSLTIAACAGDGNEAVTVGTSRDRIPATTPQPTDSESAGDPTAGADDTAPLDTEPADTEPADTEPADTESLDTAPDAIPALDPDGVGDALFPALGNPGLDVQHYDVQLSFDPATGEIDGTVVLIVDFTEDRDEFTLDSVGLDIDAVQIDGAPVAATAEDTELRITPAAPIVAGTEHTVQVDYHGEPDSSTSPAGIPNGWFDTEGGSYVLNEPDGARTWLPSNDHPSDKATFTFTITVPAGLTAVANGSLVDQTDAGATSTFTWDEQVPMATYLIQVLTGDYVIVEATGPNGLPLVSVVLADDQAAMQPYIDGVAEQIDFYDDLFGPYPLDRYGIAMTDSFSGLAMETLGRSLFSRDDFQSGELGYIEQLLLSHELGHQWFGDAVTPARWQDIWLNESFATYAQWLWLDHTGLDTIQDQASSALAGRRSELGPPPGDPDAENLFGFNSYDGGATVLHALRRTIGDDPFFLLLRTWIERFHGQSVTTPDFIALAEEVSGSDLTDFFDTWLFGPGDEVPPKYPTPASSLVSGP